MKNLFKALAEFQQEVPAINKDAKGYGYKYASLPFIIEKINPVLKKTGLGFTQLVEDNSIKTILFHVESGEKLESLTTIPQGVNLKGMNEFQVLGSAITYIRRYALSSILGLVTDEDTDASGEQTKKDTKQWLNKGTEQFTKAKEYLTNGGNISEIKKKYNISKEVEQLLLN